MTLGDILPLAVGTAGAAPYSGWSALRVNNTYFCEVKNGNKIYNAT
jgi:hypothetical protein